MIDSSQGFATDVESITGNWPANPENWSYSSLKTAERCPLQWALTRASYPEIWAGAGYPPRPSPGALFGEIAHASLETVIRALESGGCESVRDDAAIGILKGLGGFTSVANSQISKRLQSLQENPRATNQIDGLETNLRARLPELRQIIQAMVTRVNLHAAARRTQSHILSARTDDISAGTRSGTLLEGSHPEVTLRAGALRAVGRVDLINVLEDGVELVDYKTGIEDDSHAEQLRSYALLWARDKRRNPSGDGPTTLTLTYSSHDVDVTTPTPQELDSLEIEWKARIIRVEDRIRYQPPPAVIDPEHCPTCPVRQMCRAYWERAVLSPSEVPDGQWFDYEGKAVGQIGARSWLFSGQDDRTPDLILRTGSDSSKFELNRSIRLLTILRSSDPDTGFPLGSFSRRSEIYHLTASDQVD